MISTRQLVARLGLLFSPVALPAQDLWQGGIAPGYVGAVDQFYLDEANDLFYAVGYINPGVQNGGGSSIYIYDGVSWDTLGVFQGGATGTIINWHDTLVVGGSFGSLYTTFIDNIVAYVNGTWIPFGDFNSSIFKLREIDGDLYAVGAFTEVDGQVASGVAKRVGDHWEPVGLFGSSDPLLRDIIGYQGKIVVCGSVWPSEFENGGILQYDGISWSLVGGGLSTGMGASLAVYKGELYFGGIFPIGAHAGESVMRWNGSEWHSLGVGPQVVNGSYQGNYAVLQMLQHEDDLFVMGGFLYASGVPAQGIATFDSLNWCGFAGNMESAFPQQMGFYHDTLYYSQTELYLWGDTVNKILRFVGDTYHDTCTALQVGLPEVHGSTPWSVRFNAAQQAIMVQSPGSSVRSPVHLFSGAGQLLETDYGPSVRFSAQGLAPGVYVVRSAFHGSRRIVLSP